MHGTTHKHIKIVPAASKMAAADDDAASRILRRVQISSRVMNRRQKEHRNNCAWERGSSWKCIIFQLLRGSIPNKALLLLRRRRLWRADADSELHSGGGGRARAIGRAMWPARNSRRPAGQCTSSRGRTTKTCAAIFEYEERE